MNPGGGLSPMQTVSLFRRQKRQLGRRLEMTEQCLGVAEKLFEDHKGDGNILDGSTEHFTAIRELIYGTLAIQLQQLKLAQTEGKEQMAELEDAIRQAESPISRPTHQRGGL